MKTTTLLLSTILAITINSSCKKKVVEQSSDHFMLFLRANAGDRTVTLTEDYNRGTKNIIVAGDSILIKRAGLYHFDGKAFVQGNIDDPEDVGQCRIWIELPPGDRFYDLWQVFTVPTQGLGGTGEDDLNMDIFLEANTILKFKIFARNFSDPSRVFIISNFGGYRKSN